LQAGWINIDDEMLSGQPATASVLGLRDAAFKDFGTLDSRTDGIVLLKSNGIYLPPSLNVKKSSRCTNCFHFFCTYLRKNSEFALCNINSLFLYNQG
jgi:hypothetical protein